MPIAMAILFGVMIEESCDCSIVSSIGVNVAGGEKPWIKSGKGGKSGDQSPTTPPHPPKSGDQSTLVVERSCVNFM
jgi:hypothetical protein